MILAADQAARASRSSIFDRSRTTDQLVEVAPPADHPAAGRTGCRANASTARSACSFASDSHDSGLKPFNTTSAPTRLHQPIESASAGRALYADTSCSTRARMSSRTVVTSVGSFPKERAERAAQWPIRLGWSASRTWRTFSVANVAAMRASVAACARDAAPPEGTVWAGWSVHSSTPAARLPREVLVPIAFFSTHRSGERISVLHPAPTA